MEINETRKRILGEAVRISERQVDLVGRVLDLEKDTERVHSIELNHMTVGYHGLSATVYMKIGQGFRTPEELRKYLKSNNIPMDDVDEESRIREEFKGAYVLNSRFVKLNFQVPEFYPQK